jgi:uncharacterized membrane protein
MDAIARHAADGQTGTASVTSRRIVSRIVSVDALRGLVMIIMALDHVREFYHVGAMSYQPEDLSRTTAALFLTRWVTHICAPVFMFTAGMGAYFRLSRGRARGDLSRFLWTRGLWLVVLELTVLRVAMDSGMVLLSVLWALGWSMVALGFLVHLPVRALAMLSIAAIALHNLADGVTAAQFGASGWVWNIFHQPGIFMLGGAKVLAAYPLVPWIFVMSAGFCVGEVMALDEERRRRSGPSARPSSRCAGAAARRRDRAGRTAPRACPRRARSCR